MHDWKKNGLEESIKLWRVWTIQVNDNFYFYIMASEYCVKHIFHILFII